MTKQTIKAFPVGDIKQYGQRGMDLRDYIATAALQGILTDPDLIFESRAKDGTVTDCTPLLAKLAYRLADAMMREREYDNDK